MRTQYEIGVIGAGNAAEGIVHGILRNTVIFDDRIIASAPSPERREKFASRFHIVVTQDNREVVANSTMVILAVKPQKFVEVCVGIADLVREDQLIISIMAGVSTASIEAQFPKVNARVIRAMPNLPIHVGAGMAGICRGQHARELDQLHAQRIFDAGGRSIVIEDESQMDAVTAVSGSGPAYFYYFVEAITQAGVLAGLSEQQASILAKHTCHGAARMMLESSDSPEMLRQKVASPGGTTQAALESLEKNQVFEGVKHAVLAAHQRSQSLGR